MIEVESIYKSFSGREILKDISFTIDKTSLFTLLGESGSGKTTCLKLINGLILADQGKVKIDGVEVGPQNSTQLRRKMGYVLQHAGLFPHMNVFENLSFLAKRMGWTKKERIKRCEELLEIVSMPSKTYLNMMPGQLSGGQKQRIGIARALFLRPTTLLMDEPFSALDPVTRIEMQDFMKGLQKDLSITTLMVTHDISEAMRLSDEVLFLQEGRLMQKAPVSDFFENPSSEYIKNFFINNSPIGHLKKIEVRAFINKRLWVKVQGKPKLFHLLNLEEKNFSNDGESLDFLEKEGHRYIYEVDEKGNFLSQKDMKSDKSFDISANENTGMVEALYKVIVRNRPLPIVGSNNRLLGVISRETLHDFL